MEKLTGVETEYCRVCDRQHRQDQPCPMRIATYYFDPLPPLTVADRDWLGKHKDFNPVLKLEEILSDMVE